MLLLSDARIAAVPVRECAEPLVDLREDGELLVDTREQDPAGSWARLRVGVRDRLLVAQAALPDGVRLLLVEGHRPAALQQSSFEGHRDDLRGAHPTWPPERLHQQPGISSPASAAGRGAGGTCWAPR